MKHRKRVGLLVESILIALFLLPGITAPASAVHISQTPIRSSQPSQRGLGLYSPRDITLNSTSTILQAHNQERVLVGVHPLAWNGNLSYGSSSWAKYLARIHRLQHSNAGYGENLWMGTKGRFSDQQKVGSWLSEKRNFIPGVPFSNAASRTGHWQDIGHYTQMIWYGTTSIGCGMASDASSDYLVCRYSPQGNILGRYPLGHR